MATKRKDRLKEQRKKATAPKKAKPKTGSAMAVAARAAGAKYAKGQTVDKAVEIRDFVLSAVPSGEVPQAKEGSPGAALRAIANAPREAQGELLTAVPMTEDERAIVQSAACARVLLSRDEYRALLGSMIAFRQCYVVAYRHLQSLLLKEENAHPMTEDYLVQSAMHAAAKPFDTHDLMTGLVETVLPWIGSVVDLRAAEDVREADEEARAAEKARRERPVAIGMRVDMEDGDETVRRDRSLVLVGWANAVRFVLDQVQTAALVARDKDRTQVVRLQYGKPAAAEDKYLLRLSESAWAGAANARNRMAVFAGEFVQDGLAAPPDLMVVDDLPATRTADYAGRPPGATAGDAHKVLRWWCDGLGAALVAGVPLRGKDHPDLRAPEYEQLRTFADLRTVRVHENEPGLAEGHYRVRVGTGLFHFDVEKAVLDGYAGGGAGLIVPG